MSDLRNWCARALVPVLVSLLLVLSPVTTVVAVAQDGGSSGGDVLLADGFDDTDPGVWTPTTTSNADVTETDGVLRFRVYKCNRATASRTFDASGPVEISFDWRTYADQWYEVPDWHLVDARTGQAVDYTVLSGEDVNAVGTPGGDKSRSLTVRAETDGPTRIEFELKPSNPCSNFDHADTYFEVDNLAVRAVEPPREPEPPEVIRAPDLDVVERSLNRSTVRVGQPVRVTATVENNGEETGEYERLVSTVVTDDLGSLSGEIRPDERRTFSETIRFDAPDEYSVTLDSQFVGTVEVEPRRERAWLRTHEAYVTRETVQPGESYEVVAVVENTADGFRTATIPFARANGDGDGVLRATRLAPNEETEVRLERTVPSDASAGDRTWTANGATAGTVTVPPPGSEDRFTNPDESEEPLTDLRSGYVTRGTVAPGESYDVVAVVENNADEPRMITAPFTRRSETGETERYWVMQEVDPGTSTVRLPSEAPAEPGLIRWGVGEENAGSVAVPGSGPDDGEGPEKAEGDGTPDGDPTDALDLAAVPISYGETATGAASIVQLGSDKSPRYAGLFDTFSFTAEPGDAVRITVEENVGEIGSQDLAVTLLDQEGNVVAERLDDGGLETGVRIQERRLVAGGEYTVVVWSESESKGFSYDLTVRNRAEDSDEDGLTDYREKAGVPVGGELSFLSSGSPLELIRGESGNPAVTTVGGADELNAVKLDPDARDTDGDGLTDTEELGPFVPTLGGELYGLGRLNGYYEFNSDPTDAYTDGVGFDDGTERERGSDPLRREQLLASFTVPTVAQEPNGERPEPKLSGESYVITPNTAYTPSGRLDDPPKWLRKAYEQTGRSEAAITTDTHVLVDVPVYVDSQGGTKADVPKGVTFSLPDDTDAEIVGQGFRAANNNGGDGVYFQSGTPVGDGATVVTLVIDTGRDLTSANSIVGGIEADLGRLRMSLTMPTDSIYIRPPDDRSDRRISITTDRRYAIGSTAASELGTIGDGGLGLLQDTAVSALKLSIGPGPGTGAKIGAAISSEATRVGFLALASGNTIRTAGGDEIAFSQFKDAEGRTASPDAFADRPQSVRIRDFVVDRIKSEPKTEIGSFQAGTLYVTRTGVVLVRYV